MHDVIEAQDGSGDAGAQSVSALFEAGQALGAQSSPFGKKP